VTDLPAEKVTFLLTDIEGSTRLVQTLGAERFRTVLGEHSRILPEGVAALERSDTRGVRGDRAEAVERAAAQGRAMDAPAAVAYATTNR
jgi:class 3 adenylate cyclase